MMRHLKLTALGAAVLVPLGLAVALKPVVASFIVLGAVALLFCWGFGELIEGLWHD